MSDTELNNVRLLTAPGPGGVAVIEVRGAEALARLAALAGGRTARPGEVRLVRLRRPSFDVAAASHGAAVGDRAGVMDGLAATEDLDEALLVGVGADAPVVELHLHGSPPLVDEVLQLLGPQPSGGQGEPSAHRNTTFEARAEARLADVPTELGARVLVDQMHGALRRALTALGPLTPAARSARLAALVARTESLRHLFVPLRVVLAGPVNAGKSTLFNLLAGEERVVVSPEPGTTRDAIGADLTLGPYALRLVDTAGARELDDAEEVAVERAAEIAHGSADPSAVERAGQAVARTLIHTADVVLCLARAGGPAFAAPATARRSVTLRTCADLVHGGDPDRWPTDVVGVSTAPAESRARVLAALLAALELPMNPDWVRGEAVLCDETLLAEAARIAERGPCDDRALARLVALLDG